MTQWIISQTPPWMSWRGCPWLACLSHNLPRLLLLQLIANRSMLWFLLTMFSVCASPCCFDSCGAEFLCVCHIQTPEEACQSLFSVALILDGAFSPGPTRTADQPRKLCGVGVWPWFSHLQPGQSEESVWDGESSGFQDGHLKHPVIQITHSS